MRFIVKNILTLLLLFFFSTIEAQKNYDSYCKQGTRIIELMEENHISPQKIDDAFSKKVFNSILKSLDGYKLYFTQKDIEELKQFETNIDDELMNGSCNFLKKLIPLYEKRLQYGDSLIEYTLSKPIDYKEKIEIVFENKSTSTYSKTNEDLKKRWDKWIKYLTLESMAKIHFVKNEESLFTKKSLLKYEKESRDKIGKKYSNHFQSFLEDKEFFEDLIAETYFLAITTTYDPHSMYLSPELKEYFIGNLSREEKSIGIEFEEDELGDLVVLRLVPGGPSWKSNQIHIGDILLGIKWAETGWTDLSFVSTDELESMLLINNNELVLKIRKTNGKVIEIPLEKELIRADDNIIKSFILKNELSIGYISLPGFYTEFESQNQLGCANDVAKAIIKMQKENIDGLIIDLRNNGGGSLKEAIELSGIFIDFGPLTIAKLKTGKPVTIKDINRGSIYNAPLLVMVNGMSASASEMFSATMQDYNRAVIVGSKTFGKASGQDIIPLFIDVNEKKDHYLDLGYIKITNSLFYRLNCVSYQGVGITPDILLPSLTSEKTFRENDYPSSLSSDSIIKKIYMPAITPLPYDTLVSQNEKRIASDSIFKKIKLANKLLNEEIDTLTIPLSLTEYIAYRNEDNSTKNSILEEIESRLTSAYEINEVTYDSDVIKMDGYTKEINQVAINQLKKDIYLEKSYQIIIDLINIKNQ